MRIFLLVAVLVGLPMQAQAQVSGNEFVKDMREWEKSNVEHPDTNWYSAGWYIGFITAATEVSGNLGAICPSKNVTIGQVGAVVAAYLKAHPTKWHKSANTLVYGALEEAFPCG